MAMKNLGGKSKREVAREKQRKAELKDRKSLDARQKKLVVREIPNHKAKVTKRVKKQLSSLKNSSNARSNKKGENCQRHPMKDLLRQARGYKDRQYAEASFRIDGSGQMKRGIFPPDKIPRHP